MTLAVERRGATRMDKVFRVQVSTEESGDQWFVARNISASGMFVEMPQPLPLKTKVVVRFAMPDAADVPDGFPDEAHGICAMARVQNHYYLQYSDDQGLRALCGVGLRFLRFLPEVGSTPPADRLH